MLDNEDFDSERGGVAGLASRKLGERTPAEIERQLLTVSLESPTDAVCSAVEANAWLQSRAKTIDTLLKSIVIPWIDHNGGFNIGHVRYSIDYSTVVRCLDVLQTGHAVLEAAGGDFEVVLNALASQPFKYGTVRSLIGATRYGQLFDVKRCGRLVNGVPERTLKRTDTRFLR